jgi:phosphate transport system ATP-binding protein
MSSPESPSTDTDLPVRYPGGAVVQMVDGHASGTDALVVELVPAAIELHADRIVARQGDLEWTWLLDDLRRVHHSGTEHWTILEVPGVADHGVTLPAEHVVDFRCRLAALADVHEFDEEQRRLETLPPPPVEFVTKADVVEVTAVTDVERTDGDADETGEVAIVPEPPVTSDRPASGAPTVGNVIVVTERVPVTPAEGVTLADLHAVEISAWFGTHHVLDRVSLDMPPGKVTALIGPSGCGKSTFLRILNRMHEMIPSASLSGEVLLDGEDIYAPDRKLIDARRQIGMVFQKPNPFPAMSIYDNVVASYRLTGTRISASEKDEVVENCLTKAGLWVEVKDRLRSPGGGLSGGQQQRLCIARALAIRPRVLLMDEPCSALDPTSTRRIEETIIELGSEVTIVIVTHNMQQAARVSDECAFFLAEQGKPGVIVEHGPTAAMFDHPQDPRTNDYVNGRFG